MYYLLNNLTYLLFTAEFAIISMYYTVQPLGFSGEQMLHRVNGVTYYIPKG